MDLRDTVAEFVERREPFVIRGGGTRSPTIPPAARVVDTSGHAGIIAYEPRELVLRARAGTRISALIETLAAEGQILGFEPPPFAGQATLGGSIATNAAGARRPWYGAARDFVLGAGIITGTGAYLEFGGQVMKNVAGFDVARLMAGARGTLGVIADVSMKVLPAPEVEVTLVIELARDAARQRMLALSNQSLPISGLTYADGFLHVRLSGTAAGVQAATNMVGGDVTSAHDWYALPELRHDALAGAAQLWRVSLPAAAPDLVAESRVINWGGAERWLVDPDFDPAARLSCGYAALVTQGLPALPPLQPVIAGLHQRLRAVFDPAGLLNPTAAAGR